MKRILALSLIVFAFVISSASLPERYAMRFGRSTVVHAGHTGLGGGYCDCLMVQGRCPCCGYGGLTYRPDQGEDGEDKVTEPVSIPGRLALAVLRLALLRRF